MPMTPKQALDILAQAAAEFRGNRQDHIKLEEAVKTLLPLVEPKPVEEPKPTNP